MAITAAGAAGVGVLIATGGVPFATEVSIKTVKAKDNKDSSPYQLGVHYMIAAEPINSPNNEIAEFMWLGCPHCYNLEPSLENYIANKKDAVFVRHAPPLAGHWKNDSLFFYALKMVTNDDQGIFKIAFSAIQKKSLNTSSAKSVVAFSKANNISSFKMSSAMKSAGVQGNSTSSLQLAKQLELRSVPSLVIGGKYIPLLGAPGIKSYGDYFKIVEHVYKLSTL